MNITFFDIISISVKMIILLLFAIFTKHYFCSFLFLLITRFVMGTHHVFIIKLLCLLLFCSHIYRGNFILTRTGCKYFCHYKIYIYIMFPFWLSVPVTTRMQKYYHRFIFHNWINEASEIYQHVIFRSSHIFIPNTTVWINIYHHPSPSLGNTACPIDITLFHPSAQNKTKH